MTIVELASACHLAMLAQCFRRRLGACLQLRTLGAAQDWDALEALAREKRSPIGFLPFVTVARAGGAPQPVVGRFVSKTLCI